MRRLTGDRLLIATHNDGKRDEFAALLARFPFAVVSAGDLRLPVPEETEETFVGNARIKAHAGAAATGLVTLADDSGLCVEALNGAPGVHTADWAETPTGRDFSMAMARTRQALVDASADEPWGATFRCTLVLAWPDGEDAVFEGRTEGRLIWPTRGPGGHGYDPMFQPAGSDLTFAEMSGAEKNLLSHRSKAVRAMIDMCLG